MTLPTIEKNVPLPADEEPKAWVRRSFWASFEVGDSTVVQTRDRGRLNAAVVYGRRQNPPWKFVQRKLEDGSYRIWRSA